MLGWVVFCSVPNQSMKSCFYRLDFVVAHKVLLNDSIVIVVN